MNPKIWTPRYIVDRIRLFFYEKRHENVPWITRDATAILDKRLLPTNVGLEFGSGRSTAWYAHRLKHLTSVEDHKGWYDTVKKQFDGEGLGNVDYYFRSAAGEAKDSDYCKVMDDFNNSSLDFIVVDGKHRDILAVAAVNKLRKGGILLLDDSQRYLDHPTSAPYSVYKTKDGMAEKWKEFQSLVNCWEMIWTSNGVSDTTLFIKN